MTTIELDYPIELNGETISELHMRRPKVKDQMRISKQATSDEEKELKMFVDLCEVAPEVIEELDLKDYLKVQKEYTDFLS